MLDTTGKYVGFAVGVVATVAYAARARRRMQAGIAHGLYDRRIVGGLAVLILVVVGGLVGLAVDSLLGNV